MDFKRDRTKAFSDAEFEQIEDLARAEGLDLVEQMAGVLLDTGHAMKKQYDREKELLDQAKSFLHIADIYLPKDEATIGGRMSKRIKEGFKAFVDGLRTGKLKPELAKIHWEHGTPFEIAWKNNWAMMVIAASIADMLRKKDGGYWNNITCVMHYHQEQFDVTVQRRSGKSVKDQLNEAEAKIKELESQVATYKPFYDGYYK
jgi:hypothetical protein